jgi:hypothetical protein
MRKILLACWLLLLTPEAVRAQGDLPDPAQLFPDTVKVIAVENLEYTPSTYLHWDDDRHEVQIFRANRYVTYPYPEGVLAFGWQYAPIWHDLLVVGGTTDIGVEPYILNLQTGVFVPYQPQCGENSPTYLSSQLRDNLWVLEVVDGSVYLCATLTGERTAKLALPKNFRPMPATLTYYAGDFAYAVFFSAKGDVYSYAFADAKLTSLGALPERGTNPITAEWAGDNRHIVVHSRNDDQCSSYITDVAHTQSLQFALTTLSSCAHVQTSTIPMRLMYFQSTPLTANSPFSTCTRVIYDIATREQRSYEYGTLCRTNYGSEEGVGYYRAVADDLTSADVVRFDPTTGERKTLYSGGEIEWVTWVADDERFAVLLLDDNRQIDFLPDSDYGQAYHVPEHPRLAWVDLTTDTIRYQTESLNWNPYQYDEPSTITMLRDDLLLVDIRAIDLIPIPYSDAYTSSVRYVEGRIVRLTNGEPTVTLVGQVAAVLPGQSQLLVWTDGRETSTAAHLYDIATSTIMPILRNVDQTQYSVSLAKGNTANTAIVTIYALANVGGQRHGVRYTIQF